MKTLKKLFGGIELTWPKLIVAAVAAGVFTAGDCRKKQIRQITTAAADGSVAALAACRYIDTL